ncbi:MAG: helix-turn-helix transcriptional regulator [Anaerolineales bacterium]|nr:helix-turn-helix transcriptional regulator [Anaerolineales bacterium]
MAKEMQSELPLTESYYLILAALTHPQHGYGIMQWVETISAGRVVIGPGTLYGAVKAMVTKEWIREIPGDDPRRKVYALTASGKEIFLLEIARLEQLAALGQELRTELE